MPSDLTNNEADRTGGSPSASQEQPPPALMTAIRRIDAIAEWTGLIVRWLIVALTLIVVYEVAARYVFNAPTIWVSDLSYMLYGAFFMLGAAYTLRQKSHIRTDFLYQTFSVRWQGFVDLVAYLVFFFPSIALFLWFGWESFQESWRLGERAISSPWMPPLYPLRAVVPITALLLLIQGISETLKSGYAMVKGRWP